MRRPLASFRRPRASFRRPLAFLPLRPLPPSSRGPSASPTSSPTRSWSWQSPKEEWVRRPLASFLPRPLPSCWGGRRPVRCRPTLHRPRRGRLPSSVGGLRLPYRRKVPSAVTPSLPERWPSDPPTSQPVRRRRCNSSRIGPWSATS